MKLCVNNALRHGHDRHITRFNQRSHFCKIVFYGRFSKPLERPCSWWKFVAEVATIRTGGGGIGTKLGANPRRQGVIYTDSLLVDLLVCNNNNNNNNNYYYYYY
jgi:hypothetical protein